jgi:hypothetical protein
MQAQDDQERIRHSLVENSASASGAACAPPALLLCRFDRVERELARDHRDLELLSDAFGRYMRPWFMAHAPNTAEAGRTVGRAACQTRNAPLPICLVRILRVVANEPGPVCQSGLDRCRRLRGPLQRIVRSQRRDTWLPGRTTSLPSVLSSASPRP